MADMAEAFKRAFGDPDPAVVPALPFPDTSFAARIWRTNAAQLGAGWFADRFLYLFGDGLQQLTACLDAWPFLVNPDDDRIIVGRNAYGAIAFLDGATGNRPQLSVLDPLHVDLLTDDGLDLWRFIGQYLPERRIPVFVDDRVYREFRAGGGQLGSDEILAIDVPVTLGGKLEIDNFHVENIIEYYRATGPTYAKGFASARRKR